MAVVNAALPDGLMDRGFNGLLQLLDLENEHILRLSMVHPEVAAFFEKAALVLDPSEEYIFQAMIKKEFVKPSLRAFLKNGIPPPWSSGGSVSKWNIAKTVECLHGNLTEPVSQQIRFNYSRVHVLLDLKLEDRKYVSKGRSLDRQRILNTFFNGRHIEIYVNRAGKIEVEGEAGGSRTSLRVAKAVVTRGEWTKLHISIIGSYPESAPYGDLFYAPDFENSVGGLTRDKIPICYSVIRIAGDGHCLYSALALAIHGSRDEYQNLRNIAAEFIRENFETVLNENIAPYSALNIMDLHTDLETYLRGVEGNEWGDFAPLDAIGRSLKIRMVVYSKSANFFTVSSYGSRNSPRVIYLILLGNHYELLSPSIFMTNVFRPLIASDRLDESLSPPAKISNDFIQKYGAMNHQHGPLFREPLSAGNFKQLSGGLNVEFYSWPPPRL